MAHIELNTKALRHNYAYIAATMDKYGKDWGVVTKLLCGDETYLREVIKLKPKEVHDSRLSNLEKLKKLAPGIQRVYIKPPPLNSIKRLVSCADASFNTHIRTIREIDKEAGRQGVVHKVLISIELGDLREGVMGEDLMEFYRQVFECRNVDVIGLGANLNCLNGILPSKDKMVQLSLYKELINARFNSSLKWVSAGSSISLPLLSRKQIPKGCNHFRIGETLYFGNDIFYNKSLSSMRQDVFTLKAEVIEIREKPVTASGMMGTNLLGERTEIDLAQLGKVSIRAIVDIGVLDVSPGDLETVNRKYEIIGGSSDMIVVDLKENRAGIKLGDTIAFRPNYTGVLSLMSSRYIEKKVV